MLSGGKPASIMVCRKGLCRLFQVGTVRPCLLLPSPVSTTIRRVDVSTTSEWIDIFSRPSSVAKCGMSQGIFRMASLVARGRIKRVLPTVSSSTILVILTLPTFQCIWHFPGDLSFDFSRAGRCWFRPLCAMDHLSAGRVEEALERQERADA